MSGLAFRVFGLPRSGTAWVANWLTSGQSFCLHDPMPAMRPKDFNAWADTMGRPAGISCTASWIFTDWDHSAPTIVLQRSIKDCIASAQRLGFPPLPEWVVERYIHLPFPRYTLRELMNPEIAELVHENLLPQVPFDKERHAQLTRFNVQITAAEIEAAHRLMREAS